MKTLLIIVILAAAGWVGWKYLNQIDVEGSTAKQAEQFDREVKEQGEGKRAIEKLPPAGQTASEYVTPVARTMDKLKDANSNTQERNAQMP